MAEDTSTPGRPTEMFCTDCIESLELGEPFGRSHTSTQLDEIENVAVEQRNPVNGFGRDQRADGRVAGLDQRDSLGDRDRLRGGTDLQGDVDLGDLIDVHRDFVLGDAFKARLAGRDLIDAGIERDECVQSPRRW